MIPGVPYVLNPEQGRVHVSRNTGWKKYGVNIYFSSFPLAKSIHSGHNNKNVHSKRAQSLQLHVDYDELMLLPKANIDADTEISGVCNTRRLQQSTEDVHKRV